jgi:L-rhamnose isomerase/sugar isomerase
MVLEYKLFEPAFYTWTCRTGARRSSTASQLGPKAKVVVDTGHHAPGTNIEFIVASLLRAGKLGGFDFNSRFYADDDLMVGAADPFQLFRIMHECVKAGALKPESGVAFMLDQCHNIEPKIPGQIRQRDERPGGHGQGAARRPEGARGGAAGGDVLGATRS